MKRSNTLKTLLLVTGLMLFSGKISAQNGNVIVNEDAKLTKVIEIKKELNKDNENHNKYKIQIFSGSLAAAENENHPKNNQFQTGCSAAVIHIGSILSSSQYHALS